MCVRQNHNIGVAVPHDLLKRLNTEADRQMTSRAAVVRRALVEHLQIHARSRAGSGLKRSTENR